MNQSFTSSDKTASTQQIAESSRKSLRQLFRDKRRTFSTEQQTLAAKNVLAQAIEYELFTDCTSVGIYLTNDGELDTQYLIEYMWEQGIDVYLPVLHPFCKGYLLFLHYTPQTLMQKNVFGILEPILDVTKLCPIEQLDIIFTPLVAFDEQGNRMGMGGGFYDRTIKGIASLHSSASGNDASTISKSKTTKLIGLAHDVQKTLSLPAQVWDIPLPAILTPSTLYSF